MLAQKTCDLPINHTKLAEFGLRTFTPKKFADLRWLNQPKNFQIFDLRTNIELFASPPLVNFLN
jgi:hypothetical protein